MGQRDKRETASVKKQANVTPSFASILESIIKAEQDSESGTLVWLLETATQIYDWVEGNQADFARLRSAYDLSYARALTKLLEVGLSIYRQDAKTWKLRAFAKELKLPRE